MLFFILFYYFYLVLHVSPFLLVKFLWLRPWQLVLESYISIERPKELISWLKIGLCYVLSIDAIFTHAVTIACIKRFCHGNDLQPIKWWWRKGMPLCSKTSFHHILIVPRIKTKWLINFQIQIMSSCHHKNRS